MDFSLTLEQEQVRDMVAKFCAAEIAPLAFEADETECFPREVFKKWGDLGLLGVRYPEADGVMRGGMLLACHQGLSAGQLEHVHASFADFAAEL